jgi:hypothetical protein
VDPVAQPASNPLGRADVRTNRVAAVFFGKLDMSARQRWQGAAREIFY